MRRINRKRLQAKVVTPGAPLDADELDYLLEYGPDGCRRASTWDIDRLASVADGDTAEDARLRGIVMTMVVDQVAGWLGPPFHLLCNDGGTEDAETLIWAMVTLPLTERVNLASHQVYTDDLGEHGQLRHGARLAVMKLIDGARDVMAASSASST